MNLGATELLIICAIFMLLFGAKKVPDLARSLGRAQSEYRSGMGATVIGEEAGSGGPQTR
jgi:sec-independent protein translocase protein TatA